MTEAEWLAATDWRSLLIYLRGEVPPGASPADIPLGYDYPVGYLQSGPAERATSRKLRLLAAAIARGWRDVTLDEVSRALLVAHHAFLNGEGTWDELLIAESRFRDADTGVAAPPLGYAVTRWDDTPYGVADMASTLAFVTADHAARESLAVTCKDATDADFLRWCSPTADGPPDPTFQAARIAVESDYVPLLRDIFGNPFRPVAFDPAWRTDTAVSLASQMYESRDFGAMPILADALQDAGCTSDDILGHCRDSHATHVRGCWVVDLVLDKN
jgi:hypothetical protein